jgi:hypothetical protein
MLLLLRCATLAVFMIVGAGLAEAQSGSIGPAAPAPGIFTAKNTGAAGLRLTISGQAFTSREALEIYLAYRAAEETKARGLRWFTFTERRNKSDKVPLPQADMAGPRFSFRLAYFRPMWRYRTAGSPGWKAWSPFSGAAFPTLDPKTVTAYELSADIVMRKGLFDDANPLAFDASPLSDFLINQAETPK